MHTSVRDDLYHTWYRIPNVAMQKYDVTAPFQCHNLHYLFHRKDDEGDSVADRTGPERQYTHRRRASRSPDDGTTLTTTHRRRASRSPDERTTLTTTHRRRASRSPDERTTLSTTHRRIRSPDGAVKSRRELRGGGNAPSDDLKSDKHTRRRQSRSRSRSTERKHRTR